MSSSRQARHAHIARTYVDSVMLPSQTGLHGHSQTGLALSVSHTEAFWGDSEILITDDALAPSIHMLVTLTRVAMTQAGTILPSPTLVRICDDDTRRKLCRVSDTCFRFSLSFVLTGSALHIICVCIYTQVTVSRLQLYSTQLT